LGLVSTLSKTKKMRHSITIVIPTHQRAELLARTLESLSHLIIPPDCRTELLVIANACTDATEQIVQESTPNLPMKVRFIDDPVSGLSRARNRAVQEANGDILAFFDDDVWVYPDWLANLLSDMDETEADIMLGKAELDWQAVAKPVWFDDMFGGLLSQVDLSRHLLQLSEPLGAGCNMAIRTSLFASVGTFSERMGRHGAQLMGGEDTDLIQRALDAGANVFFSPHARVKHWVAPQRLELRYLCAVGYGFGYIEMLRKPHLSFFWVFSILVLKSSRIVSRMFRAVFSLCCGNTAASRKYLVNAATATGAVIGLVKRILIGPPRFSESAENIPAINPVSPDWFQWPNATSQIHNPPGEIDEVKLKIGLVCNEYPPKQHGGIGTATAILAEGFARKGHKVTVLEFGLYDRVRLQNAVRIVTLRQRSAGDHPGLRDRWELCKKISQLAQNGELDILECPDYLGLVPFGIRGCPVVIRLRNTETIIRRRAGLRTRWLNRWAEDRTLSRHRAWVPLSEHILQLTQSIFHLDPTRRAVIPNALSVAVKTNFPVAECPGRYILHLGRVSSQKGAILLARAARPLLEEFDDLTLVYLGAVQGERNGAVDRQIREILGETLSRRCQFTGYRKRPQALHWLQHASLLVVASDLEAHPNTVAEAMLLGVPVVAPNAAPFTEFIQDGHSGLLMDPKDAVAFKSAMRRILLDPELAARLTTAAKSVAEERFCAEKIMEQLGKFYRQCIAAEAAQKPEVLAGPIIETVKSPA